MKNKKTAKSSGKRIALIALCSVLAIILAALLGVTIYAKNLLGKINYVDKENESTMSTEEVSQYLETLETETRDETMETINDDEIDWGENDTKIGESENIVNILLIGQDARAGWGRSRSDVMILATFNKEAKTLTLTSFLRDLYVQIPGYGNSKLTHTYVWGGMDLLNTTLENNFGVIVDGNVEVDFERFAQLIDLLGGVDMELRQDEAYYINNRVVGSTLSAGYQHLNGDQALIYARIRALDADADFSRTNRQRKVLTSLIEKFKTADLSTILSLLEEAMPMLTTDLTQSEIVSYVTELFPLLADCTVVSQRIPADNAYTLGYAGEMAVVKADMDAARKLLEDTLGVDD